MGEGGVEEFGDGHTEFGVWVEVGSGFALRERVAR